jgi:alkylation response protein AidB-like acyl-CoA dehydrogenase
MEFGWREGQRQLHERMRELGRRAQETPAAERLDLLAKGGVLGLCIASDHGGGGHDLVTTAFAFEGLGRELDDAGVLLAAGAHLFGVALPLEKAGSDAQRARWLPPLCSGRCLGTVAATEAGAGSDVAQMQSQVAPRGDGWLVRGDKRYVTNADRSGLHLFVGQALGVRGLTVALVPGDSVGIEIAEPHPTLGLEGARLAAVRFSDCALDADAILGKPGAGSRVFQIAMTYERALVLAFRLGAMERQLEQAKHYARSRRLGDQPIARHQAVSHRVARMKLRLETARLMTYRAAWELDQGKRGQVEAALTKWHVAEQALDSSLDALRLRGGEGFLSEGGFGRDVHEALGGTIHSGTSDVLATIVASWLGL